MTVKTWTRATLRKMKPGDAYPDHKLGPCLVVAFRPGVAIEAGGLPINTVVIERAPPNWDVHAHFAGRGR
jgi:hypothetical protein